MKPHDFIIAYEKALQTQQWKNVDLLMHNKATVTFSNGTVNSGKDAVRVAYEKNFSIIKNEIFKIQNVQWINESENYAVYVFEFKWKGVINEQVVEGAGTGTSILIKENNNWLLLAEHLGAKPAS